MNAECNLEAHPYFYDREQLVAFFLRIPADKIVDLNFLLESYDGLGIARTLDADHGEVVVLAPLELSQAVTEFLASVSTQLEIRGIEMPRSVEADWLLGINPFGVNP